jgi:hypothetical protein
MIAQQTSIVVINEGVIIAVKEYDPKNDGKREERIMEAIESIAIELGIPAITTIPKSAGVEDALGNKWGRQAGNFQIGMVEVGIGKWGFEK